MKMNNSMKEINIEITHDCALACVFCSSSADHPSPLGQLSIIDIEKILESGKKCGASVVSISGGEPFLHPEILLMLQQAINMEYSILLYTSGIIFDDQGNKTSISMETWSDIKTILNDCEKSQVIFDVQGTNPTTVDRMHGVEGAFGLIIESIKRAKLFNLSCAAHFVPMKPNVSDLLPTVDMCEKLGIQTISFLRFVPQGRGSDNCKDLLLSPVEFSEIQATFLNILEMIERENRNISVRIGHPIDFMFLLDSSKEIKCCRGGIDAPSILPNGDIYMCPAWKNLKHLKAGNIHEQSLDHIWGKATIFGVFNKFLQNPDEIKGSCSTCKYLSKCKGKCTAQRILHHSIDGQFPECLYASPDPLCPLANNLLLELDK